MSQQNATGTKHKTTMSTRNIVLMSLTTALVTTFLPFFYLWWMWGGGAALFEQNRMTAYLGSKYNQDFVVGKAELGGGTIGIPGTWSALAYPKNDSSLKFSVGGRFADGYSDQYIPTTWAKAETARIQPDVKRIFAGIPVNIRVGMSTQSVLADKVTLTSPTYKEAVKEYPDYLTYHLYFTLDQKPDVEDIAERAYTLMQVVKQGG